MYGIGLNLDLLLFFYAYPLFSVAYFSWSAWPLTFAYLVSQSPYKRKLKWWLFMPVASFAACLIGSFFAGLVMWLPTAIIFHFQTPYLEMSWKWILFVVSASGMTILFSVSRAKKLDKKLNE